MRRLLFIGLLGLMPMPVFCWGFFGHKQINRIAVYTLPTELMAFYKQHIEFISEHAVDPDMRRYVMENEAIRHYIDIDHYGDDPFNSVPREWHKAIEKYSIDTIEAYGVVPWHIHRMYGYLVEEFKAKDLAGILKTSADLGHYIADAHVPLHTTENYNGQLTNQHGIHGFWESRLPELFAEDYDFFTGRAAFIADPLDYTWDRVEESHAAVDSVLRFEQTLNDRFPSDRKYAFEERGRSTIKTYSRDYSTEYHVILDGMVERRMRKAIVSVGSIWYSAWVEAGQPNLTDEVNELEMKNWEEERQQLEADRSSNAIKGRAHED